MALDGEEKKKLLWSVGAIASLVGIVYLVKKSGASSGSSNAPAYPSGVSGSSGGSSSALTAAQLQAASQMTVAQSQERIALATIEANRQNVNTQAQAARDVARSQEQGKIGAAAMAPGGAATTAAKGLADGFVEAVKKWARNNGIEVDSQGNPMTLGASGLLDPGMSVKDQMFSASNESPIFGNQVYNQSPPVSGNFSGDTGWGDIYASENPSTYGEQPYVGAGAYGDYYQGSSGGGDSSWFGSSPIDSNNDWSGWGGGNNITGEEFPTNYSYMDYSGY